MTDTTNPILAAAARPLLSVVLLSPSGEIPAALLRSLDAQTVDDFELIVVGGESQKWLDAGDIARVGRYPRVHVGAPFWASFDQARAIGFEAAQGEYICCLYDEEFELDPSAFERMLFSMLRQDLDVCAAALELPDGRNVWGPARTTPSLLMTQHNLIPPGAIFHRRLLTGKSLHGVESSDAIPDQLKPRGDWPEEGVEIDVARYWELFGSKQIFVCEWTFWLRALQAESSIYIFPVPLVKQRALPAKAEATADSWNLLLSRIRDRNVGDIARLTNTVALPMRSLKANATDRLRSAMRRDRYGDVLEGKGTGILVSIPFLVKKNLITYVITELERRGFRPTFISTCNNGVYMPEDGPWASRTADVFHMQEFLPQPDWVAWMAHLVESRKLSVLLQAGNPFLYEQLRIFRKMYPEVGVVDALFNKFGHVHKSLLFAKLVDRYICENDEMFDFLRGVGIEEPKIARIPNGVDLDSHLPSRRPEGWLSEFGFPSKCKFVCGYLGRFSPEKNPEAFVALAERLRDHPEICFMMIGKGPQTELIRSKVEALGMGDRFCLMDSVDSVVPYMGAFDVMIVPSRYDGRPIAVQEAAALGVPVIGSKVGGIPELIEHGVTGFITEVNDIGAIAAHVVYLSENPAGAEAMRVAVRHKAEREFSEQIMFEQYAEVLLGVKEIGQTSAVLA